MKEAVEETGMDAAEWFGMKGCFWAAAASAPPRRRCSIASTRSTTRILLFFCKTDADSFTLAIFRALQSLKLISTDATGGMTQPPQIHC